MMSFFYIFQVGAGESNLFRKRVYHSVSCIQIRTSIKVPNTVLQSGSIVSGPMEKVEDIYNIFDKLLILSKNLSSNTICFITMTLNYTKSLKINEDIR